MATVHSISGPPSPGGSAPRGPTYHLATRELSADFSEVGPDQTARDLGPVDGARFLQLLEKLSALDAVKLIDADPQLFVTVKSGRFLIQPQSGKLLVRPVAALDQIFFRLSPAEIPPFLDGAPPPAPKNFTTLIGSAAVRAEAATGPGGTSEAVPAPPRKRGRSVLLAAVAGVVVVVVGVWWLYLRPAGSEKTPPPSVATTTAKPAPEFDLITSPAELASLQKRFVGTYATSGDAGERLLELRDDGTFHYQEFGTSLSVTSHDNGPYTFVRRHGLPTNVLRAGKLGAFELRDENSLVLRDIVFTRLPAPPK